MYNVGYIIGTFLIWAVCFFIACELKKKGRNYPIPLLVAAVLYVLSYFSMNASIYLIGIGLSIGSIFIVGRIEQNH